ncbi:MAG: exosortase/archaeosortase family protein, partial [Candidatus Micrarchaeia archaeon]
ADPYSYQIIIPPMFLILVIFFYRKHLVVERDVGKLALGTAFLISAALLLYASSFLPNFGFDILSLPLFVASCILLFFSTPTLEKMLFPVAYLFLLWAPLFQPLLSTQTAITNFTTDIVHFPIKLAGLPIERDGNIFHSGSRISLEVVPECVPLSTFIALLCFLLPFAHVARGELKFKLLWLFGWIFGGWVLDVLRIAVVLFLWYYSGLSLALQVFHAVGGNIIFDICIVLALLSMKFFKLELQVS